MEPGRFDLLQNGLVRRLAEDAADHFSMSGIPGASNYHDEIRARLLETLPQMAERPKAVNSRRYLGDAETSAVERTDNTRTRVEDPSRLTASPPQGIAKGAMPDNPFSDPEINDQIRAKVRRLQAASLEWDDNPDGRSFDDFRVETLVENLDAHAEPYLCKVDSEDLISQYGEYMRGVGSALIRNAEQRSFLSDPYGEARLREMAENSGSLMNRILFLKPGERESEVQSEVERLRAEFMPKAVAWHQWRSQMRSRIEARFEARYRRWEADAIERLRNRGVASGAVGRSKNLESLKASIDEDIQALVKQQRSTLTWEQQMMGASPPPRTFNLNDPFEANLFSVLERGAPELTESAVAEAVQQDGDEALRPAKRSAITEQIYPFIEDRWLNTGFDPLHGAPGMAFRAGPTLNRLREVLDRTLQDFSPKPERAGDAGPKAVKTASAQRHQATISNPKGPGRKRGPKPDYKTVPRVAEKPFNHAGVAKAARAKTVARIIHELDQLKPQMFEDESEYNRLRAQHPDFLTFKIAERRPDLKTKVLAIQGSTRHIRLAQELAAAHHGRQLSTIRDDWKDFKPKQFKRSR
jgi:hypothetical protein